MMGHLGRYLARRYAIALAGVLALLVVLITCVSLVESSRTLMRHPTGLRVALALAGCTALEYAHLLFPVATLLALVVVGTQMARRGELAGLQAQGTSLAALAWPLVAVSLVATLLAAATAERILPQAAALRRRVMAEELRRVDPATLYFQARSTWHHDGPWIVHLPRINDATDTFLGPTAYCLTEGRVTHVFYAQSLAHTDAAGWQLGDVVGYRLDAPGVHRHQKLALPLKASPAALMQHMGNPRELGHRAAHALIARRRVSGLDTTLHHIEVVQRLIYPWSACLLLLAGLPWALDPDRRRGLAGMLCASVGCIAYLLVGTQVARLLALAHRLSPEVGATAPLWLGAALVGLSVGVHRWGGRRLF